VVAEEYIALLHDSIRLRLRSDAPVAVNLSGGVDSSALLALIDAQQSGARSMRAFTFITRDRRYDELPWVEQMLAGTRHRSVVCALNAGEVPDLAAAMQASQDEPFGGVPTMAYDRLFARARAEHVTVLLDGQGLDEQWAGYDYYAAAASGSAIVQGATDAPVRPDCLAPSFARLADVLQPVPRIGDPLQRLQMRDVLCTKIPRALRYNDRAAMRHSIELREPFLDHRLVELAIRQPADRKISGGVTKVLLRQMLRRITPDSVVTAPKRPVQTPQREWLREPLRDWANDCVAAMLLRRSEWLDAAAVTSVWQAYTRGESDNSFYVWQWISLALCEQVARDRQAGSTFPTDLETTMAGELCESV
jgi:asparagine synthase (glutamine-hydrolysing)